jgi:hypothetical protein
MKQGRSQGRQLDGLVGDGLTRDGEIVEWHRYSQRALEPEIYSDHWRQITLCFYSHSVADRHHKDKA